MERGSDNFLTFISTRKKTFQKKEKSIKLMTSNDSHFALICIVSIFVKFSELLEIWCFFSGLVHNSDEFPSIKMQPFSHKISQ